MTILSCNESSQKKDEFVAQMEKEGVKSEQKNVINLTLNGFTLSRT
jgi:hypothetical protein